MKSTLQRLAPSLSVAVGILGATLLAVRLQELGWWVMGGPLLLALAIVAAGSLARRAGAPAAATWWAPLHALVVMLASSLVAAKDPALVAAMLPILGAVSVPMLSLQPSNSCCAPAERSGRAA